MTKWMCVLIGSLLLLVPGACVNLDTNTLLPVGTPFVVVGTMTTAGSEGPCPVWVGDNGESYYLYQDPLLDNNTFDRIATPGVTSRLVIAVRRDLTAGCENTTVVEVQSVLEIRD